MEAIMEAIMVAMKAIMDHPNHLRLYYKHGTQSIRVTGPVMLICPYLHVIRRKGAAHTSSFEEEFQALSDALEWIADQNQQQVLICTDSQSLCEALLGYGVEVGALRRKI